MNFQARGFLYSSIIHIALLFLVVTLNSSMMRFNKPVVIDFSIDDSAARGAPKTAPEPKSREPERSRVEQSKPQPLVSRQEISPQQEAPQQVPATSEAAAGSQAPVPARPPSGAQPVAGGSPAATNAARQEGKAPAHGQGEPGEALKQSYLKEHFAYIRNIVQKQLSYPAIARRMGWEGKVLISFIVCTDGHARDITIREGSGIEMLDKNAVAAVRDASPFPKPPLEARLIIPISYRLD